MAKKTKTSGKTSKKKVDLTKNKTSRPVNTIARNIEKEFRDVLKKSNIVVFNHIVKEMSLDRYFLNRKLFVNLLGSTIHIMDYAMRVAVANTIRDTVMDQLTREDRVYPGYWDVEAQVISMAHVNIVTGESDPNRWYLSIKIGATSVSPGEINESLDVGDVPDAMEFSEYNPNKLAQLVYKVSIMITQAIVAQCAEYPDAMVYHGYESDAETVTNRYTKNFRTQILDNNEFEFEIVGIPPYEKNILKYLEAMEKPMVMYFCYMIASAGIGADTVQKFVNRMKIHAIFNSDKAKTLADVSITYLFLIEGQAENNQVTFEFDIKTLASILSNEASTTKVFAFGTKLRNVMHSLVDMCTTMCIDDMNKENEEASEHLEEDLIQEDCDLPDIDI